MPGRIFLPPVSGLTDVGRLRAFRTIDDIKGHPLAFIESPESILVNGCMVNEYIISATIYRDKTKTF